MLTRPSTPHCFSLPNHWLLHWLLGCRHRRLLQFPAYPRISGTTQFRRLLLRLQHQLDSHCDLKHDDVQQNMLTLYERHGLIPIPVDKGAGQLALVCPRFYLDVVCQSSSKTDRFAPSNLNSTKKVLAKLIFNMPTVTNARAAVGVSAVLRGSKFRAPYLYCTPKWKSFQSVLATTGNQMPAMKWRDIISYSPHPGKGLLRRVGTALSFLIQQAQQMLSPTPTSDIVGVWQMNRVMPCLSLAVDSRCTKFSKYFLLETDMEDMFFNIPRGDFLRPAMDT